MKRRSGLFAVACVFLLAKVAAARPEYPGLLQTNFAMKCAPSCGLCHLDPNGGGPRNPWGNARGPLSTIPAAATAFTMLMPPDFDGDGVSDVDELKQATNPGMPGAASVCPPEYGISCKVASAPANALPRVASFALLAAGIALVGRRRGRSALANDRRRSRSGV
ncbi:MAG TPA: hypothetical protein VG937_03725 [Polyangiaceae bacterium]|jgi:hypothetical protein|nr:hypothetical protein [Polyangiaceae bacterium]